MLHEYGRTYHSIHAKARIVVIQFVHWFVIRVNHIPPFKSESTKNIRHTDDMQTKSVRSHDIDVLFLSNKSFSTNTVFTFVRLFVWCDRTTIIKRCSRLAKKSSDWRRFTNIGPSHIHPKQRNRRNCEENDTDTDTDTETRWDWIRLMRWDTFDTSMAPNGLRPNNSKLQR